MSSDSSPTARYDGDSPDAAAGPTPDPRDEALESNLDDAIPSRAYQLIPMVGLGGSAGSIQALQQFFEAVPRDPGMVFVVILHLAPDHESQLVPILQRWTAMPVKTAEDDMEVQANCVYVIPPAKQLIAVDRRLRLRNMERNESGKRVAVDLFFRSMADTHGPRAAAVVLSGMDGDGAIGIKRIRERGGLTIAQDPDEAEHASMPQSAVDTGMVDWVLKASEMPSRLQEYFRYERALSLLPDSHSSAPAVSDSAGDQNEAALREVLSFLRTRTGRDFSYYKRATVVRRVARRLQVNGVASLQEYTKYLRMHPGEAAALLQDLLISVTNFFRDRDAFLALEKHHIPELFRGKRSTDVVRVWVPACATGEEAYSMAILLSEHARKIEHPPSLQVFACDLDEAAIRVARAGLYPAACAADLTEDRLRRFFVQEHGAYRVRRELREMVLFATHDLLRDAPFSRMDLISCRNLLIYLSVKAQRTVMETFAFALNPSGRLFLGASESVPDDMAAFRVLDRKHRIYEHRVTRRTSVRMPAASSSLHQAIEARSLAEGAPVVHGKRFEQDVAINFFRQEHAPLPHASTAELHYKLIEQFAPPSLVVNSEHDIVHLSENAGRFLQFSGGETTSNLLRMVHPALRTELRAALFRAAETGETTQIPARPLELHGQKRSVELRVAPARDVAPGYFLVVFEEKSLEGAAAQAPVPNVPQEPIVGQLERELEQLKRGLRESVEQHESSMEELKASNEELQAMNEELRSASEELESSREELQSINEELTTVNLEMKSKVDELGHANSDLQNLMASTAIAILFLDRDLAIMRYTPRAIDLFNVIPTDVGRPLGHLKHNLDYPEMLQDCSQVLRTLVPVEREARQGDRWYLCRTQPYRTLEDQIAGVVMTFVDVTERRAAEENMAEELRASECLRQLAMSLVPRGDMGGHFGRILDTALDVLHADAGTVQILDAASRQLRIIASRGFSESMTQHFAAVDAGSDTSCGAALMNGRRVFMIFDDPAVPDPAGSMRLHRAAGLLSAQSTPLVNRAGQTVGILSTHWKIHFRAGERDLRYLDLLARQAADAIDRKITDDATNAQLSKLQQRAEG